VLTTARLRREVSSIYGRYTERGRQASLSEHVPSARPAVGSVLGPLLVYLDGQLDKRLVRTLGQLVQVIIEFRHASHGLL